MTALRPPDEPPSLEPGDDDTPEPLVSAEDTAAITSARENAFTAFYNKHWLKLLMVARLTHRAGPDSEDHVQDVLFGVWKHDIDGRCEGCDDCMYYWCLNVLRNKVIDARRKAKSGARAIAEYFANLAQRVSDALSPVERFLRRDKHAHVERAIWELPECCRELFVLIRVNGMKYAEAAKARGIEVGTVGPQLAQANRLLSKKLRPLGYGALPVSTSKAKEDKP